MTHLERSIVQGPGGNPTLGELLTHAVRSNVPTWLYQLLHLAFPLAVDFAFRGWWRPAGWALAVAAFGVWGLADRWLWEREDDGTPRTWAPTLVRIARVGAGVVACGVASMLALELFLRLLGAAPTL